MEFILVTGGFGFIGSHICVELLNKDKQIIIVDNLSNSSASVGNKIKEITGKNLIYYCMDVQSSKLETVFENHNIEYVIHLAGIKSVNESIKYPMRYYDTNINSTLNLLHCMEKFNCHNLIFSSSATVYGSAPAPLTEESPIGTGISNPYGETKFVIERLLMAIANSDPKWHIISLRYFNPIGAHKSGLIGENPNDIPNNLMPYIMRVAYHNTNEGVENAYDHLTIFGNDYDTHDGTCLRDYIHVVDLANAHLSAMNYISKKRETNYHYFNIGTGKGTSVMELVNTFSSVNNCKLPYIIGDRRPGDLPIVYCNNQKALEELGWKPTKNVDDMCKDAWNFQTKC